MRKLLAVLVWLVVLCASAYAQAPSLPLSFNASVNAPDAAAAQAYEHRLYVDNAAGVLVTGLICTSNQGSIVCSGQVPSVLVPILNAAGSHRVEITAQASGTPESPRSAPFSRAVPALAPSGLRIGPPAQ